MRAHALKMKGHPKPSWGQTPACGGGDLKGANLQEHLEDLQDHLQDLQDHLQDLQKPTRKLQESYKQLNKSTKIYKKTRIPRESPGNP